MATNDTRIAILGGRGMLGTDLTKICRQQGFKVKVFDLPEFDITNSRQLKEAVDTVKTIINCAAYTDVNGAESEAELAYQVNAEAVGRLGAFVKEADAWLLHISTDFVFDGKLDRPYLETDTPNPINEYGKTKLAGEQLLAQSGCRHCIIRIEWTYGSAGNNFISKLTQRAKTDTDKVLKVVDDQIGSPTATTEVAKVICELLRIKPTDLFHFASAGYVSRYEMAKFIFDNLSIDVTLLPCKTSDYVSAAVRPLNSRFDCSKIRALLDEPVEPWQVPLEHFLRQL
jgi:dTDP-4-dehydrorhamnose reductase